MEIKIRKANDKDFQLIYNIEQEVFNKETESSLIHSLNVDFFHYFIAFCGDKCVGFVAVNLIGDEAEILSVAVSLNYRKNGVATELLNFVFSFLKDRGVKKIFLEVAVSNKTAQMLYNKLDFFKISVRKNYYSLGNGKSEDAIIMQKKLIN